MAGINFGVDVLQNGRATGLAGEMMGVVNRRTGRFDSGLLRPFIETDPESPDVGRPCAEISLGMVYNSAAKKYMERRKKYPISQLEAEGFRSPVFNSVVFTRDNWIQADQAIQRANRLPLTAYDDLRSRSVLGGFDAWSKLTIEYAAMSDPGEVVKDMDATSPGRDDAPLELIRSTPLPVIHGDFSFPQRLLDVASSAGMPLDTTMFEAITRRIWEMVEKTYVGTETGLTWGGRSTGPFPQTGTSTEWGLTNYQYRVTKTDLTTPTGSNPEAVNQDVQEMIETMRGNGFAGPFTLYYSTPYGTWINADYFRTGSTSMVTTLRQRIMLNEEIAEVKRLDYLTSGYQLILVDYNRGQIQAVNGMMPRAVQWSERGGYIQKFMVLAIQTQIFRTQYSGISPIIHGTTS